jgi:hypothetical protein
MTTLVTCQIVKNGLSNPLMRKVATKIKEECTSTDGFKAKLTQIEDFKQRAKPQKNKTPRIFIISIIMCTRNKTIRLKKDTKNKSGSTRNNHTIRNRESDPERNQRGKRDAEDGKRNRVGDPKRNQRTEIDAEATEATNVPRMQTTRKKSHQTHGQTMLVQHAIPQQQHTIICMVRTTPDAVGPQGPHN